MLFLCAPRAHKVHEVDPENGNVTLSLAMLYDKLGDVAQATVYMEEVVAENPHLTHLLIPLSQIYHSEI